MSEYKQRKGKVTGVPGVPKGISKELQGYLRSLSELIETKVGIRGNALDRHVTLRELQDAGVVDKINQSGKFNANAINVSNRGFTNTGTLRMYKSQLTPIFQSAVLTFKHGLGRVPDLVQVDAHCISAENTYVKGDIIVLPGSVVDQEGNNEGMSIVKTSTEIQLYGAEHGFACIVEKDGTGGVDVFGDGETSASEAKFSVEVKAFIFESSKQGN